MPIDVREALVAAIQQESQGQFSTEKEAEAYVQQLEREKRYTTETWY